MGTYEHILRQFLLMTQPISLTGSKSLLQEQGTWASLAGWQTGLLSLGPNVEHLR